jgi:hypothetical protein
MEAHPLSGKQLPAGPRTSPCGHIGVIGTGERQIPLASRPTPPGQACCGVEPSAQLPLASDVEPSAQLPLAVAPLAIEPSLQLLKSRIKSELKS